MTVRVFIGSDPESIKPRSRRQGYLYYAYQGPIFTYAPVLFVALYVKGHRTLQWIELQGQHPEKFGAGNGTVLI